MPYEQHEAFAPEAAPPASVPGAPVAPPVPDAPSAPDFAPLDAQRLPLEPLAPFTLPTQPLGASAPVGDAPVVPPWEAQQAAEALAELKAQQGYSTGLGGGNLGGSNATAVPAATPTDEAKRAQRQALIEQMERDTRRLEREVAFLNGHIPSGRTGNSGYLLGDDVLGFFFKMLNYARRPEWLILGVAIFCFVLWLIASGLKAWVAGMAGLRLVGGQ